jgi:hypothetical protein
MRERKRILLEDVMSERKRAVLEWIEWVTAIGLLAGIWAHLIWAAGRAYHAWAGG